MTTLNGIGSSNFYFGGQQLRLVVRDHKDGAGATATVFKYEGTKLRAIANASTMRKPPVQTMQHGGVYLAQTQLGLDVVEYYGSEVYSRRTKNVHKAEYVVSVIKEVRV